MNYLIEILVLLSDLAILYYVRGEYLESKELNMQLSKVYKRSKRRKLDANRIVKELVKSEVAQ